MNYIKWGFESRLKLLIINKQLITYYIKWGFESRLKHNTPAKHKEVDYIKWGFESRLKHNFFDYIEGRLYQMGI